MLIVPERLAVACRGTPERRTWLGQLPDTIRELQARWSLSLADPFDGSEVTCSWVARATRADGSRAVLKLGMPHMEAAHELQALRFWDGDPTVRLLEDDVELNAMLLRVLRTGNGAPRIAGDGPGCRSRRAAAPPLAGADGTASFPPTQLDDRILGRRDGRVLCRMARCWPGSGRAAHAQAAVSRVFRRCAAGYRPPRGKRPPGAAKAMASD